MTYPQPTSDQAVLLGESYWRLQTELASPGDLYESVSSALGFAVGPDSDIANISITYLDPQKLPSQMNDLTISPTRSYVGLINARNDVDYPDQLAGPRPGRIFISSVDVFDPSYEPTGYNPATDSLFFEPPLLDVIQYFNTPPSLVPQRSDKQYFYKAYPSTDLNWIVIPFYGRKYAYLQIENHDTVAAADWRVFGVTYSITANPAFHLEKVLQASTPIASGAEDDLIIRASTSGVFDAIVIGIEYTPTGNFELPLKVTVSDNAL